MKRKMVNKCCTNVFYKKRSLSFQWQRKRGWCMEAISKRLHKTFLVKVLFLCRLSSWLLFCKLAFEMITPALSWVTSTCWLFGSAGNQSSSSSQSRSWNQEQFELFDEKISFGDSLVVNVFSVIFCQPFAFDISSMNATSVLRRTKCCQRMSTCPLQCVLKQTCSTSFLSLSEANFIWLGKHSNASWLPVLRSEHFE